MSLVMEGGHRGRSTRCDVNEEPLGGTQRRITRCLKHMPSTFHGQEEAGAHTLSTWAKKRFVAMASGANDDGAGTEAGAGSSSVPQDPPQSWPRHDAQARGTESCYTML